MLKDLVAKARSYGITQCYFCKHCFACKRKLENKYGLNPVDAACKWPLDNWVDEDALLECIRMYNKENIYDGDC